MVDVSTGLTFVFTALVLSVLLMVCVCSRVDAHMRIAKAEKKSKKFLKKIDEQKSKLDE